MNPIEKAIRGALEKGDAEDRAYREKVYRSVHAAVERTIESSPDMAADAARQRRDLLKQSIRLVESEFVPAVAPPVEPRREPRIETPALREPTLRAAEPLGPVPDDGPHVTGAERREAAAAPESETRDLGRRRGRGLYAALFLGVTVVAAVGMGAWWAMEQGLFLTAEERDGSVPNPPALLDEEEEFDPAAGGGRDARPGVASPAPQWIVVFDPTDPSLVTTPEGTVAELVDGEDGQALRIRSGDRDSAVLFDVGRGILEQVAGRRALFDIVARSEDGEATQISVTCNFGELGDCGRNRYDVGNERSEYLFDLELPKASPGAAGTIAIATDIETGGRSVDIFGIRVAVQDP